MSETLRMIRYDPLSSDLVIETEERLHFFTGDAADAIWLAVSGTTTEAIAPNGDAMRVTPGYRPYAIETELKKRERKK